MDDLSAVLDAVRMRGQMYCRLEARAPWAMRAKGSPVATFHGVVRGDAVLQVPGEPDVRLAAGDLVLLSHGSGHAIGDAPDRESVPIEDVLGGADGSWLVRCGGRGAQTVLVCGGFSAGRDGPPLLSLMPPILHVQGSERVQLLLTLLSAEGGARTPGADVLVARLTEALFVEVVRAWLGKDEGQTGAWIRALRDTRIARALTLVHQKPSREWTVATLAREVGMSRSGFALTFAQLLGEPPLSYVQQWRLYAARSMLRESAHAIAQIAERVGYDSEASLSKAFKRRYGMPPGAYRKSLHGPAEA